MLQEAQTSQINLFVKLHKGFKAQKEEANEKYQQQLIEATQALQVMAEQIEGLQDMEKIAK